MASKKKSAKRAQSEPAAAVERPVAMIVEEAASPAAAQEVQAKDGFVVFAFRLTKSERDEIHAAAGKGGASRFVKAVALAGARKDTKAMGEILDGIR